MCVFSVPEGCADGHSWISFVEGLRRDCYAAVEGELEHNLFYQLLKKTVQHFAVDKVDFFIYNYHLGKDDSEDMAKILNKRLS